MSRFMHDVDDGDEDRDDLHRREVVLRDRLSQLEAEAGEAEHVPQR